MSNKILKANKQYCGMLGLKINVKLRGDNMSLQKEFLPFLHEAPVFKVPLTSEVMIYLSGDFQVK